MTRLLPAGFTTFTGNRLSAGAESTALQGDKPVDYRETTQTLYCTTAHNTAAAGCSTMSCNTPYNNLDEKLQYTVVLIPLLALSLAAGSVHYQLILYQLITLLYIDGNDVI